jgi:hypothetical protein
VTFLKKLCFIIIGKLEGTVIGIDSISMILKTKKGKVVIPIKKVVEKTVEVEEQL